MNRAKLIFLRVLILLAAVAVPAAGLVFWAGKPATFDVATLDAWAPVKDPGPSTRALAQGVTRLAGPARTAPPDWFTAEDQDLLAKAEADLHADKLQASLGHLMVLSSHLDERGKTLKDFLPLVAPDIASWLVASYFAPLLLGTLLVVFVFLIFLPWLVRRLVDALKVLAGVAIGAGVIAAAVLVSLSIAGQKALVFTAIEYLVAVVVITVLGNVIVLWGAGRKPKPKPVPGPAYQREVPARRERPSVLTPAQSPPVERRPAPAAITAGAAAGAEDQTVVGAPGAFAVRDREAG